MISGFSAPEQSRVDCSMQARTQSFQNNNVHFLLGLSLVPCSAAGFLCVPEVLVLTDSFIYQQEMKLQQPCCSGRAPILFPKPLPTRKTSNPISHHQHQRLGIINNNDEHPKNIQTNGAREKLQNLTK